MMKNAHTKKRHSCEVEYGGRMWVCVHGFNETDIFHFWLWLRWNHFGRKIWINLTPWKCLSSVINVMDYDAWTAADELYSYFPRSHSSAQLFFASFTPLPLPSRLYHISHASIKIWSKTSLIISMNYENNEFFDFSVSLKGFKTLPGCAFILKTWIEFSAEMNINFNSRCLFIWFDITWLLISAKLRIHFHWYCANFTRPIWKYEFLAKKNKLLSSHNFAACSYVWKIWNKTFPSEEIEDFFPRFIWTGKFHSIEMVLNFYSYMTI